MIEFHFPDIHRCKIIFPDLYSTKDFFLSVGVFPQGISLQELFSFEISLWDIFLSEITIPSTPQKSNGRSLKEDWVTSRNNVCDSLSCVGAARKVSTDWSQKTITCHSFNCFSTVWGQG